VGFDDPRQQQLISTIEFYDPAANPLSKIGSLNITFEI
jgi:hypothetical protein